MSALTKLDALRSALEAASEPEAVLRLEGELEAYERHLEASGMLNDISPVRELRMRARWQLGRMLADMAPGRGGAGLANRVSGDRTLLLKELGLAKQRVTDLERIAALPEEELERAFAKARELETLITATALITIARPYWAKERREAKHREIASSSRGTAVSGTFALIYADPPWQFQTYSELGKTETSPDNHYPTLGWEEIGGLEVDGRKVSQLAAKDAGLFMWCTSSNLELALPILRCWGFTYRTHLIWDKVRTGTGYIFLNRHELLLYAKRGDFPMPAVKWPSVLAIERTTHSAKPGDVRRMLESMYPEFTEENRIELFARGPVDGWTTWGNEATGGENGRTTF